MDAPTAIVIGAGVIGCSAALELAQRGFAVTVIERERPGAEASSVAAGILAARIEYASDPVLGALSVESRELHATQAQAFLEDGLDVGFRRDGALLVTRTPEVLEPLARGYDESGVAYERLDPSGLRVLEPELSGELQLGLFVADEASLEPERLIRALVTQAERRGVRFVRGIARGVVFRGGRAAGVALEGAGAPIEGDAVVVAAGSWSSLLAPEHVEALAPLRLVEPVRGQLVHVEAPSTRLARVVFGDGGYVVPRRDGRYVCGATMERVGFDRRVTVGGVHHALGRALALVPALADAHVVEARANLRPASADERPLVGRAGADGLFFATGHFRNGILLSAITARLLADVVTGNGSRESDPRLALLDPRRGGHA